MITLTRFNQTQLIVNADLIEFLEATPDTIVSLVTGRKVLVRESVEEVIHKVIEYRRKVGPLIARMEGMDASLNKEDAA